jgi:hypothetical protein
MVRHLTTGMDGSKVYLPWVYQPTSGMDGSLCGSRRLDCVVGMDGYLNTFYDQELNRCVFNDVFTRRPGTKVHFSRFRDLPRWNLQKTSKTRKVRFLMSVSRRTGDQIFFNLIGEGRE